MTVVLSWIFPFPCPPISAGQVALLLDPCRKLKLLQPLTDTSRKYCMRPLGHALCLESRSPEVELEACRSFYYVFLPWLIKHGDTCNQVKSISRTLTVWRLYAQFPGGGVSIHAS